MAEPAFQRGVTFNVSNNRCIKSDPNMKTEKAAVDSPETDRLDPILLEPGEQSIRCDDRIVRHPNRSRKDIGRPAGKNGESGRCASEPGGNLVECAVAAKSDDRIESATSGILGKADGMPSPICLDDFNLMVPRQQSVDNNGVARIHR
jgi:hypothetical protein